jgi:DNA-binding NarL/FixJ family response regulator
MTNATPDLTPQECQVLTLVVQGRTNREIRARLRLGRLAPIRTLSSLYQKSGLHPPGESCNPNELRRRLVEWGRNVSCGQR